jgi:hypothetical protein
MAGSEAEQRLAKALLRAARIWRSLMFKVSKAPHRSLSSMFLRSFLLLFWATEALQNSAADSMRRDSRLAQEPATSVIAHTGYSRF